MEETSYFQWLCELIGHEKEEKSYFLLLGILYETPFIVKNKNDINRAVDGNDLKGLYIFDLYRQNEQKNIDTYMPEESNCSILEMIIGISKRMMFILADDDPNHDDFSKYFWEIIDNLGLKWYDDEKIGENAVFYKGKIDKILENLNERTYQKDGFGGMFPLINPEKNQRKVEIWYQMQEYINQKYALEEEKWEDIWT